MNNIFNLFLSNLPVLLKDMCSFLCSIVPVIEYGCTSFSLSYFVAFYYRLCFAFTFLMLTLSPPFITPGIFHIYTTEPWQLNNRQLRCVQLCKVPLVWAMLFETGRYCQSLRIDANILSEAPPFNLFPILSYYVSQYGHPWLFYLLASYYQLMYSSIYLIPDCTFFYLIMREMITLRQ